MLKSASWLPRILLAIALPIAAAEAQWTRVNQPSGRTLKRATILSNGAWVGVDTAASSWTSTDRGATWSAFRDAHGGVSADVFGDGIVSTLGGNDSCWMYRYDPGRGTWDAMNFDRKFRTSDTATTDFDEIQSIGGGPSDITMYFSDSVLAFQSLDSARTWKLIAGVANSDVPGGPAGHSGIAGGRLWLMDTVRQVLRGTATGRAPLEIPYPSAMTYVVVGDSLPGGGWYCLALDSSDHQLARSTKDSGRTWIDYDISRPGAGGTIELSDGWTLGLANPSGVFQRYVRHGTSGSWTLLPEIRRDLFVDGGRIYGIGDSGLMSLDLGALGVRTTAGNGSRSISWRLEGSDIVVSGTSPATGWEIRDPVGRNLSSGRFAGAPDLRIPTGGRKGLLMVRITGSENRAIPVLVP